MKAIRKLLKIIRINFFGTLEIRPMLPAIWGEIIQESG